MTDPYAVPLDRTTHTKLTLLADAWSTSPSEAVSRLIEHFWDSPATPSPAPPTRGSNGSVAVHALYEGQRIDGHFDPATRSLTIPEGPGAGHHRTPSGAASAVLHALKPKIHTNRNGWSFWTVDATGEPLQSIRAST
ncbi:hypothetical protein ABZ682_40895 [Streptomyces griseoviridis]|uniref:hypothetical protein n=1 Tax=Streptomyces TaxID=1883 RepID=UPI002476D4D5|nr:hypothetical protein [Streptomyces sp. MAA16]